MGSNFSFPLQEPLWFSYYGPIRHTEASEALDAAIASHLQEIGASSSIPIRKEVATSLTVPVALNKPPFLEADNSHFKVSFACTSPGQITLQTENQIQTFPFDATLDNMIEFETPKGHDSILKFDFDVLSGVSCRMYTLQLNDDSLPTILDDKMVVDGVLSTVSRAYRQDAGSESCDDLGFSDGNCLICCSAPATVVAFPCRHCCMCRACSERFASMSSHCPVCRAPVHELIDCNTESE